MNFSREILLEPEGGAGMLRVAPRILMNIEDLDSTGLITPASRATFRLLLAGEKANIEAFYNSINSRLKQYESWAVANTQRDEVRATIGRIVTYVRLATLLTLALCVITMALAAQGLWGQQIQEVALLRCLGQEHKHTLRSLLKTYMMLTIPAALIGISTGYGLQFVAIEFLEQATAMTLPGSGLLPLFFALLMCIVIVLTIIFPILLSVKQVSAISLLRSGTMDQIKSNRATILSVFALLVLVTLFLARSTYLSLGVLGSFLLASLAIWALVRAIIFSFDRLIKPKPFSWYVALKSLSSNSARSAWLTSAFAITIFALALLGIIRSDIFNAWQKNVPTDAPNVFMMNIKSVDRTLLTNLLVENHIPEPELFAIIRGRIASINGKPIVNRPIDSNASDQKKSKRERMSHDFNLTELDVLPAENVVVEGSWFDSTTNTKGFSVEHEIAEELGLKLGDELAMNIAGKLYEAEITSLRSVKWENMKPNFYIIASPGTLDDAPRNYITGIYSAAETDSLIHQVNKALPNVAAIDIRMILTRFRTLVNQGGQAVSVILLFTMAATLLVLVGVLQGQKNARRQEIALLKSMGANGTFVRKSILTEFAMIGSLAGFVGGGLAIFCASMLARRVFQLPLDAQWDWLFLSIILGMVIVAATGYISTRRLLTELPGRLFSGNRN
ncbi:MAG: FtsX-like permease family protein [Gammaproteobacteria bacterium]|nr:FtsX-like permease family protein [Gammaproteobacteria bacterium]